MNFVRQHIDRFSRYADPTLLIIMALLIIISFAAAFSTSSNLVNLYHTHSVYFYLMKHFLLVATGLFVFFTASVIPVKFWRKYALALLLFSTVLVFYTDFFGSGAGPVPARRWIRIGPISLQSSIVAMYFSFLYTAAYLDSIKNKTTSFGTDLKYYWVFLFLVVASVVIHNNSTALLIFGINILIHFLGGYAFRKILSAMGISLVLLLFYFLAAKAFPQYVPNRFDTLIERFSRHFSKNHPQKVDIQSQRAKIAIATGGLVRFAPGKSVQKNLLSQSSSDFIYAIIVEEYGALLGGLSILVLYVILSARILGISRMTTGYYTKLSVLALGLPLTIQAMINMLVATGAIPVTGQPLPFISAGGTTLFMTAFALGIITRIGMQAKEKNTANQ